MKNLKDIMNGLPAERRAKIEARADALIAEELTLKDLRKAKDLTQKRMAELLGVGQDNISRLEGRTDMLLSTLRSYITAMGGSLDLIVRFPDRPDVSLSAIFGERDKATGDSRKNRTTKNHAQHRPA